MHRHLLATLQADIRKESFVPLQEDAGLSNKGKLHDGVVKGEEIQAPVFALLMARCRPLGKGAWSIPEKCAILIMPSGCMLDDFTVSKVHVFHHLSRLCFRIGP